MLDAELEATCGSTNPLFEAIAGAALDGTVGGDFSGRAADAEAGAGGANVCVAAGVVEERGTGAVVDELGRAPNPASCRNDTDEYQC